MSIVFIHDRLAITLLIFCAICALWGFWNFARKQPVTGSYWGALAIAEILAVVQGLFGMAIWISGQQQPERLVVHMLYGATAVLSLPAVYVYSGGRDTRRENMLYALACVWLFFIVQRGIDTGVV